MHFIANQAANDKQNVIENDGWFPDINLHQLRGVLRLDGTVTEERLIAATVDAMLTVNLALIDWQTKQVDAGFTSLATVPAPTINKQSHLVTHYCRAVMSTAKADLIEKYRDYDTTASSQRDSKKNDYLDNAADTERRNAHWAIADLLGRRHVTVELI